MYACVCVRERAEIDLIFREMHGDGERRRGRGRRGDKEKWKARMKTL